MTREERGALVALLAQEVAAYRDDLVVREERKHGTGAEEAYTYAPNDFSFWDEDALEQRLGVPLLGYGVSRIVVQLPDGNVAKLPWLRPMERQETGFSGNDVEYDVWRTADASLRNLLLPVLDYFPASDVLVVPFAEVLDEDNPESMRIVNGLVARLQELESTIADLHTENCGFYTDPATGKKRAVVIDYAQSTSLYE